MKMCPRAAGTQQLPISKILVKLRIYIPRLRSRKRDIAELILTFLDEFCVREGKVLSLSDVVDGGFSGLCLARQCA